MSDLVFQQVPLNDELVLKHLTSDRALESVLMQIDVSHERDIVPAHFPAKALKVYLDVLLVVQMLPFQNISLWLESIFMPVTRSLKQKGVGEYRENRAILAAAGIKIGKQ